MSLKQQEVETSSECICGSGKEWALCCKTAKQNDHGTAEQQAYLKNASRAKKILKQPLPKYDPSIPSVQGYLFELAKEAKSYAAQLFTSKDEDRIEIVSTSRPDAPEFLSLVVVPDESLNLEDCIQYFGNLRLVLRDSIEGANEELVYSLYQEICDRIPYEDRVFDDCLKIAGKDACTREEYEIHFDHLKANAKTREEGPKAKVVTAASGA